MSVLLILASAAWALAFGGPVAIANATAFTMTFLPLAVVGRALPAARGAVVAGGAWLALSPLVLGYAWPVDVAIGCALILWLGAGMGRAPITLRSPVRRRAARHGP
jgi:hypothetical protein